MLGWTLDLLFGREIEQMITLRDVEMLSERLARFKGRARTDANAWIPEVYRYTTTSHNVCGCLSSVGKPCLIASRDNPLLFLPCGLAVTLLHRVKGAEATAVARWRGGWR
jgi:hypothetical protein